MNGTPSSASHPHLRPRCQNGQHPSTLRRRLGRLLLAGLTMAVSFLIPSWPADAVGVGGPQPFGLTPTLAKDGQPRPYFQYALRPGATTSDLVVISNAGTKPLRLKVSAATGVTAPNSGSAFTDSFGPCAGTACWVTGLPASVTLKPGQRQAFPFRVHVPVGTRPRQYLAGITAEPAGKNRPVPVGGNGHSAARAVIVEQATVGVAVTVGQRSKLTTRLAVRAVTAGYIQSLPRIALHLQNTGQTFTKASGTMRCAGSTASRPYPVIAETILPGDQAAVPVNAPGLPTGRPVSCHIHLRYGHHILTWSGTVKLTRVGHSRIVHTKSGTYSTLPRSSLLPWAIVLIAVLAAALLALAALSLRLAIRQRRQRSTPTKRT